MANINTMVMNKQVLLQKFYVYDPGVSAGDEFGGLRVIEDAENGDALHVLAARPMVQYWIDQGLAGSEPLTKVSGAGKKLLSQITRGRSENDEDEPARLPRYSKATQSGAPQFAATLSPFQQRQQQKSARREGKKEKTPKRPAGATPAPQKPQSPST